MPSQIIGRCLPETTEIRVASRLALSQDTATKVCTLLLFSSTLSLIGIAISVTGYWIIGLILIVASVFLYVSALTSGRRGDKIIKAHYLAGSEAIYAIGPERIVVTQLDNELGMHWAHFDKAIETPGHFVLWHGLQPVIIPKRAFSDDDVNLVRAAVATHMAISTVSA
jgi:hypothetical protein